MLKRGTIALLYQMYVRSLNVSLATSAWSVKSHTIGKKQFSLYSGLLYQLLCSVLVVHRAIRLTLIKTLVILVCVFYVVCFVSKKLNCMFKAVLPEGFVLLIFLPLHPDVGLIVTTFYTWSFLLFHSFVNIQGV